MATSFVLKIDLADHAHPQNLHAQHAIVRQFLGNASQALGMSLQRRGDITHAAIANGEARTKIVGFWEFSDDGKA